LPRGVRRTDNSDMPLRAERLISPEHELELRAALLPGDAGLSAAREWLAQSGLDALDEGSRRLLPLLYRNLKTLDPANPALVKLRQVHLGYWGEAQKILHRTAQTLRWIHARGVETLVLKGVAFSILHYRDPALRPMADFDILVPAKDAPGLVRQLRDAGWVPCWKPEDSIDSPYFYRYRGALNMIHPEFGDLDLHWRVFTDFNAPETEARLWRDAVPLRVKDVETKALSPTHSLLHAALHGAKANRVAPVRWVADAMAILRSEPVDWAHLADRAAAMRVALIMHQTLAELRDRFGAPVPESTLRELAAQPVSRAQRRAYERLFRLPDDNLWSAWDYVDDTLGHFRRVNRGAPWFWLPANLAAHLRLRMGPQTRMMNRAREWFRSRGVSAGA
jgi:hypothetical protein